MSLTPGDLSCCAAERRQFALARRISRAFPRPAKLWQSSTHAAGLGGLAEGRNQAPMGGTTMVKTMLAAFSATAMLVAAANAQQAVDWDKVQIKTTDLGNKTYMLEGQGGNITFAVGTDGIIMVDTQFAQLSEKIKAAIRTISPLPIKYIVNTHFHGDHTGGNANF